MVDLLQKDLEIKTIKKSNGDLAIQQTQSRELRATIIENIKQALLETFDIDATMGSDGLVIIVPNDNEGYIPVVLDIKMKSLDYDYETATKDYNDKLKAKEEKKAKKAATTK